MFQYAFGYSLSKKHNDKVCFDLEFYDDQPKYISRRSECLRRFFPSLVLDVKPRPNSIKPFERKVINHILYRFLKRGWKASDKSFFFKEKRCQYYHTIPYKKDTLNYYDGYWQTEEYFSSFSDDIRRIFAPSVDIQNKVDTWLNNGLNTKKVALHVRRGDLFGKRGDKANKKTMSFYKNAIDYFSSLFGDYVLYVLSDDIDWCRENLHLTDHKTYFVNNDGPDSAIVDLFIIAGCDCGIMSPSTFSWWGNWLGDSDKDRVVIAQKGFYYNTRFIPQRWLLM